MSFFNNKKGFDIPFVGRLCGTACLHRNKYKRIKPFLKKESKCLAVEFMPLKDEEGPCLNPNEPHRLFLQRNIGNPLSWASGISCVIPEKIRDGLTQKACQEKLNNFIHDNNFKVIYTIGEKTLRSVLGDDYQSEAQGAWDGCPLPCHKLNSWVYNLPLYTHFYRAKNTWEQMSCLYLKKILQDSQILLTKSLPRKPTINPTFIYSRHHICEMLQHISKPSKWIWSVDFETTGIKPDRTGHRILCAALYNGFDWYAFPVERKEVIRALGVFMSSPAKKTAHNKKFEGAWSRVILKMAFNNCVWCSMTAAHIIDGRKGVTGLKYHAARLFGLFNYDKEVEPYMSSDPKEEKEFGGNAFNKLHTFPIQKLLRYCATDVFVGWHLMMEQRKQMGFE